MKFFEYVSEGSRGLAVQTDSGWRGLPVADPRLGGDLLALIQAGRTELARAAETLAGGDPVALDEVRFLPPISRPEKIICVGLNYRDHSSESGFEQPDYPTLFGRFNSSLVAHGAPLVRPRCSELFDYEGELVAVIGRSARDVAQADALDHVAGYSIFNDASVRDYQFKSPQWTAGKNFDGTGAFGPWFVSADELPPGCAGLRLETRLNGEVVQQASVDDMVFPVAALVSILSEVMTLRPGDLIVTGTPSGVGVARSPPVFMTAGDVCEVEIERIGLLRNPVVVQPAPDPGPAADLMEMPLT